MFLCPATKTKMAAATMPKMTAQEKDNETLGKGYEILHALARSPNWRSIGICTGHWRQWEWCGSLPTFDESSWTSDGFDWPLFSEIDIAMYLPYLPSIHSLTEDPYMFNFTARNNAYMMGEMFDCETGARVGPPATRASLCVIGQLSDKQRDDFLDVIMDIRNANRFIDSEKKAVVVKESKRDVAAQFWRQRKW